uniref:Uncharacterized protein n=1 Tax=Romanomermis culicivorax TaxID=13658 RepID=A0A915KDD6_ROMCU
MPFTAIGHRFTYWYTEKKSYFKSFRGRPPPASLNPHLIQTLHFKNHAADICSLSRDTLNIIKALTSIGSCEFGILRKNQSYR